MEKLSSADSISPPWKDTNEEYIGLAVVYPRAFSEVPFEPTALIDRKQLKNKMQSCVRLGWTNPQEIYDQVVSQANPKNNCRQIIAGLLISTINDIQSIRTIDGDSAIQVTASGTPDYRAHVDIGTTNEADMCIKNNKETIRNIRQKLIDGLLNTSCAGCYNDINFWPQLTTIMSWLKTQKSSHFLPCLCNIE